MRSYKVSSMTEEDAKAICEWEYKSPYDLYQFLPWSEMQALEIEFGDPEIRIQQYISIHNEEGILCGFGQYFQMEGVIRLGLGMRPDLTGKGSGTRFVASIIAEALQRFPDQEIDLEVLTWNERAIYVYERCGFQITDTYERRTPTGMGTFHCMVYEHTKNTTLQGHEIR